MTKASTPRLKLEIVLYETAMYNVILKTMTLKSITCARRLKTVVIHIKVSELNVAMVNINEK